MIELTCLCGQSRMALPRKPDFVHACNCSLCAKSGAHWAYFDPAEVTVEGASATYVRQDKAEPSAALHFCPQCGSTTHFRLTPQAVAKFGDSMMGVNMRLADEADLAGVERRYPDGRGWAGDGPFDYVRPTEIIGVAPSA